MNDRHPIIEQFEAQAELLDIAEDESAIEDAVAILASWIDVTADRLSDDDLATLVRIGGTLYRQGLYDRISKLLQDQRSLPSDDPS